MTERGTNSWIVGRGKVAIIDPGPDDSGHLSALLSALAPSEQVVAILVTHAHQDHAGLARRLARDVEAPIVAFGRARDGMRPEMAALKMHGIGGGEGVAPDFFPDRRLGHGEAIEAPGWRLEAIHTPGHMSNHICLAWEDLCFTGDHVMGWSTSIVSPPDGDMQAYMGSLRLLSGRAWRAFLPGHGPVIDRPSGRLDGLSTHRLPREAAILAALEQGPARARKIAEAIYLDTPPELMLAATRNVLAHLIDLLERNLIAPMGDLDPETRFRRV
jgi:glyoxylase-like metal-dependent hydrolase (beta-lactamase superfamily II)